MGPSQIPPHPARAWQISSCDGTLTGDNGNTLFAASEGSTQKFRPFFLPASRGGHCLVTSGPAWTLPWTKTHAYLGRDAHISNSHHFPIMEGL